MVYSPYQPLLRQKRFAEIATLRTTSVYNQVYPIQKPEYSTAVTEESQKAWILVLLTSSSGNNVGSRLLTDLWRQLASKFGDIKFCQMQADLCIEGYPDKNTPTILVYKDGDIKRQIVTLKELAGDMTSFGDLEDLLRGVGAVKPNDSRLRKREVDDEPERGITSGSGPGLGKDDSDSDWD